MSYRIYRPIEGISINGKEFICGDDGEVKLFDSIDLAKAWLKEQDPTIDVDAEDLMDANGLDIEEAVMSERELIDLVVKSITIWAQEEVDANPENNIDLDLRRQEMAEEFIEFLSEEMTNGTI
jgi:hypothetical protein